MPRPKLGRAVRVALRLLILDIGSHQIDAMDELEQCDEVATEMVRYQNAGYQLVNLIALQSSDSESRDQARRAFNQFWLAESLQARIAAHVHQGIDMVDAGQTATRQAMTLVTHWREGS